MSQQTLPERRTQATQQQERFDPFGEFEQMTERMQRLLDRTLGGVWGARNAPEREGWSPVADITEQDDAYLVQVELPGVKSEDVTIELVGNELSITGEVKEEHQQDGVPRRRMRRYGRFDFRVALPDQLDAEKVEANLEDGILTVRVPKAERAERRQIDVRSGSGSRSRTSSGSKSNRSS